MRRATRLVIATVSIVGSMSCAVADQGTDSPASPPQPEQRANAREPSPPVVGPVGSSADEAAQSTKRLDLSPALLHKAIADTDDFAPLPGSGGLAQFGTGETKSRARIDQKFRDAEIPTCMTMDAWKFEQPQIGFIPVPGFFALPWLIHVIATGKCRH